MEGWGIITVAVDIAFITGAIIWIRANNSRIEQRLKFLESNKDRLYDITTEQTKSLRELTELVKVITNLMR